MTWVLGERWLWTIIIVLFAILIGPLLIIEFIFVLPGDLKAVATILIVVFWGVFAGYRDWLKERREKAAKETGSE